MVNIHLNCIIPAAAALFLLPLLAVACPPRYLERREHGVDQIPYIVYVEMRNMYHPEWWTYHATGTIIDSNIVLTSAYHCETSSKKTLRVWAGQTYVNPKTQQMNVVEYLLHPKRERKTYDEIKDLKDYERKLDYNFCLMRLDKSMTWSATVQRAPLPFSYEQVERGQQFMASGWGPYKTMEFVQGRCQQALGEHRNFSRASLFYSNSQRSTNEDCKKSLSMAGYSMRETIFCLGHPCKDFHTSQGDEGGPVMTVTNGKVIAMVSNINELDRMEAHTPNSDLAYAVDWINEVRKEWIKLAKK